MPDADPDHDTRPERRTNPRFDNWPVGQQGPSDAGGAHRTPRESDSTLQEVAQDSESGDRLTWVGLAGSARGSVPVIYDGSESAVYEGEFDDEEARIVLRDEARRETESDSLGKHIEEFGQEHSWHWLSSFAREHLEDVRDEETPGLELQDTEFMESALPENSPADSQFFGSFTFADPSGRVHVLERRFTVTDREADRIHVDVEESYHVASEPRETERAGDADTIDSREYTLERHLDPNAPDEAAVENTLREFHESHPGFSDEGAE